VTPAPKAPAPADAGRSSPELESLLRDAAARLQPEVQRRLQGLIGSLMRAYLPQAWVFQTDVGTATLVVDRDGAASAIPGASASPDVTVEIPYARLAAALRTGSRTGAASESVSVTPHTAKGRAAFDYLRQRVGL